MACVVEAGQVAVLDADGLHLPDGSVVTQPAGCEYAIGSVIRFYYADHTQEQQKASQPPTHPSPRRNERMEPTISEAQPVSATANEAAATQSAPAAVAHDAEPAPLGAGSVTGNAAPQAPELHASEGAVQEVGAAADAASKLGGDYAPIVAIVLAAIAVLGGSKAWGFYKERSAQQHELALKQLDVQAQAHSPTVQPPPCQAAQAKVDAELSSQGQRITELERKAASAERRSSSLPDVGELDDRVSKLEKAARAKKV